VTPLTILKALVAAATQPQVMAAWDAALYNLEPGFHAMGEEPAQALESVNATLEANNRAVVLIAIYLKPVASMDVATAL
jgi:hypothetical protein